jgi:DNA-binding transcriptional regulator GbsR (MarR family)
MKQPNLFSDTAPYQAHSDTSKEAAEAIEPWMNSLRGKVYQAIHMSGKEGLTDLEIEEATGISGSTVRPRRIELLEMGLVRAAKEKRQTPSGRWSYVWVSAASLRRRK